MRVVLVRLSALGDIVHSWPLARALQEARADIHLSWVVEEPFLPLVKGHPAVDSVFTVASRRWRRRPWSARTRAETAALRSRFHELQPELALDSQGVFKSALITHWTAASRRIGLARPWRREWLAGFAYTETVAGAEAGSHVTDTNLEFVRAIGQDPPPASPPDGAWLLERVLHRAPSGRWREPYAVMLPGAGKPDKILPGKTLAAVAREISASRLDVVVAWGPGERPRAAAVVEAGGAGTHLAPPTDLEELTALLGGASLVIGGDTGPVHLAASLGVPTLAVFLTTDWHRNGPLGARTAVVSGTAEPDARSTGSARAHPNREVGPEEIERAARELLSR